MTVYCLEEFKTEVEKLGKKNSYAAIETDIIAYFFGRSVQELASGTRLNNSDTTPLIKMRVNGSGGLRVYYLLLIKEGNVYLMFVHPKTGSLGYDNITDASKSFLYKKVLEDIKESQLYVVTHQEGKLQFTHKSVAEG